MKKTTAVLVLGLLSTSVGIIAALPITSRIHSTNPEVSPLGRWYMGTATGFDCNLVIKPTTMTVQYGGCFAQQEPIVVAWTRQGDHVVFENAILKKTLGAYLTLRSYQGKKETNLILVPQKEQEVIAKYGYVYAHCFWKNLLPGGLQWPQDAKYLGPGPEPIWMPPYQKHLQGLVVRVQARSIQIHVGVNARIRLNRQNFLSRRKAFLCLWLTRSWQGYACYFAPAAISKSRTG